MNELEYRKQQVSTIPRETGVYALCDLDKVPIYVGKSDDGIQNRVRRHLTSARSDIIANRQVDIWEIAYVFAWPLEGKENILKLEAYLYHLFNEQKTLMNGSVPAVVKENDLNFSIPEVVPVRVMSSEIIETRKNPTLRFPRQIMHISRMVDHILNVKSSEQLNCSLKAHYQRMQIYYEEFIGS